MKKEVTVEKIENTKITMIVRPARFCPVILLLISSFSQLVWAQGDFVAPAERCQFNSVTSYDSLQSFLHRLASHQGITIEHVATSRQQRNITLVKLTSSPRFGMDSTKLRVLLFAQQHGDEPSGKEALTLLLARFASAKYRDVLSHLDLLIVPQMNPDGAELGQRRTADSIDLNRNHVLLTSPETKALHDVFHMWRPHVTMDIHEYSSFSSSWSDSGFIKTGDVQLGMLTNLNTSSSVRELQHKKIYPFIAQRMKSRGYSFHEYIVGSPDMYIRHSTTEVNDGRQSFGILGTVSFIQEGRKWKNMDDHLQQRSLSQLSSVEALLEYCANHALEIGQIVSEERHRLSTLAGRSVAVRMDHTSDTLRMSIPVKMLQRDIDTTWQVHPYRGEVKLLRSVMLPKRYLIERRDSSIVALLHRHHIAVDTVKEDAVVEASSYSIDSIGQTVVEEDTLPFVSANRRGVNVTSHRGDFSISTAQLQSYLLAIVLEPESYWGLTKHEGFSYLLKQERYPVLRIP